MTRDASMSAKGLPNMAVGKEVLEDELEGEVRRRAAVMRREPMGERGREKEWERPSSRCEAKKAV